MDASSDRSPHTEDNGAGKADALNVTAQGAASNEQQESRDPLDDKFRELEQKLAALNAENSPSRSSSDSFRTAREQMSPVQPSAKALGKRKEEGSPKRPSPVLLSQQGSRRQSSTTVQTSSRRNTSHRPSTRRNSTAPTSQFPSASSSRRETGVQASINPSNSSGRIPQDLRPASASNSRRSSFLLNQQATTQTTRHIRRHQRTDAIWPSITIHPDGRQALQSARVFSDLQKEYLASTRAEEHLPPSSSRSLPAPAARPATADTSASTATRDDHHPATEQQPSQTPVEYSNHVPAANIDWTSPSTRRREYEKIDRARRGVRGLIRRVTPRCLRKNGRAGFHVDGDGAGSDAGTVRRFRMDVEDGDGDGAVDEGEGVKGRWWKIGKKMGKGKGTPTT